MQHEITDEEIERYGWSELAPERAHALRRHFAACASCRDKLRGKQTPQEAAERLLSFIAPDPETVPSPPCPDRDRLIQYADERLGAAAAMQMEDHLGWCVACAATFSTLKARKETPHARLRRFLSSLQRPQTLRPAMAGAFAVGFLWAIISSISPQGSSTGPIGESTGAETFLGAPGHVPLLHLSEPVERNVGTKRPVCYWTGIREATSYRVRIRDKATDTIVIDTGKPGSGPEAGIKDTNWTVPIDLQPGRTYEWDVIAYRGQGEQARARAAWFKVVLASSAVSQDPHLRSPIR